MRKLAALLVSERTDDGAQRCVRSAPSARAWEDKPADRMAFRQKTKTSTSDCLAAGISLRARGPAAERRYPHEVDSPQV